MMENLENIDINIEEMAKAGVHLGHKVSKLHPRMKPYLAGIRKNIYIFNLEKTKENLKKALSFISELISQNKTILFVGTKVQFKELIKNIAQECNMPYVNERWLGGTFTNFDTIKKRINYFKELKRKKEEGELEKYTKKEQSLFNKELTGLQIKFGGIENMEQLPAAVFIADLDKNLLCAKEARKKNIKIIAICDTNVDPEIVDYPIPANDDAISACNYILGKVKEVIINTKNKQTKL